MLAAILDLAAIQSARSDQPERRADFRRKNEEDIFRWGLLATYHYTALALTNILTWLLERR